MNSMRNWNHKVDALFFSEEDQLESLVDDLQASSQDLDQAHTQVSLHALEVGD